MDLALPSYARPVPAGIAVRPASLEAVRIYGCYDVTRDGFILHTATSFSIGRPCVFEFSSPDLASVVLGATCVSCQEMRVDGELTCLSVWEFLCDSSDTLVAQQILVTWCGRSTTCDS